METHVCRSKYTIKGGYCVFTLIKKVYISEVSRRSCFSGRLNARLIFRLKNFIYEISRGVRFLPENRDSTPYFLSDLMHNLSFRLEYLLFSMDPESFSQENK